MASKKKASKKKTSGTTKTSTKQKATKAKTPKLVKDEDLVLPETRKETYRAVNGPKGAELKSVIRNLAGQINKGKDHKVIASAEDVPNTYELRRPSGIMQLDIDLAGGAPGGTLVYMSGPDGSGKTFLTMRFMLMQQLLYGDQCALAFAGSESGFDFRRARNMGLKIAVPDELIMQWDQEQQLRGFPAYTKDQWLSFKEQTGEFELVRGFTGEEILTGVLELYRSKVFNIIALDSVSALQPSANAEKELDENNKMAAHASMVTDFMKKFMPLTTGLEGANYSNLIFTAQVRSNPKKSEAPSYMAKYMKEWSATGAWAARHTKAIDINVWDGEKIKGTVAGFKENIGKVTKYEFVKGKYGTHDGITGEYKFFHEGTLPAGVDAAETVMVEGMRNGVIIERNGSVSVIKTDSQGDVLLSGIPNLPTLKRMMEVDFEFELAVRREVLASKGIMCLYR